MSIADRIIVNFDENPAVLGRLADVEAVRLSIPSLQEFRHLRLANPIQPRHPIPAVYDGANPAKHETFRIFNQERKIEHNRKVAAYEKNKRLYDLLNSFSNDWTGYGAYLIEHHPQVSAHFGAQQVFEIEEENRRMHTYVTGGTGSGKSECLKSLVWHYLTEDPSSALIFLDPHSDVAQQIAQFRPNCDSDRLVYIRPRNADLVYPGLNPFDIDGKESLSDEDAEDFADEFIHCFDELLEDEDAQTSVFMRILLENTLPVILKMPDTSIYDLIEFLKPKPKVQNGQSPVSYPAQRYLDFAREHFSNPDMLDFLFGQFEYDNDYVRTRNSITSRLRGIFGGMVMQALFRGKRTVRLEELIRDKKLVVFNLAGLGTKRTGVVGRFILIMLKIFALNQAKVPKAKRTHCHVFVDECQKFVTGSMQDILQEARKFYVYLTLAQQSAGQHPMKSELFEAIRTNCAVKMAGANHGNSLEIMSKETGVPADAIANFVKGQFAVFQREATHRTAIVRMPSNTLVNSAKMDSEAWHALLDEQIRLYYRRPDRSARKREKEAPAYDVLQTDLHAFQH